MALDMNQNASEMVECEISKGGVAGEEDLPYVHYAVNSRPPVLLLLLLAFQVSSLLQCYMRTYTHAARIVYKGAI